MALILNSATVDRDALPDNQKFWLYNALDAATTIEVLGKIEPELKRNPHFRIQGDGEDAINNQQPRNFESEIYDLSRAINSAAIDMMRSGIRIDDYARGQLIADLTAKKRLIENRITRLYVHGLRLPLPKGWNPNSPSQIVTLMYEQLGLPKITNYDGASTVDRDALERLSKYPVARPFCLLLLALRDTSKLLSDVRTEIDPDNRIRTSLSVAGTSTGRMSSYKSGRGTGRNLQNIDPQFRHIFTADPGQKFAYIDLEQAEARSVGATIWSLFGDDKYLDACESSDLHTEVAKLVWPHIKSREDAEQLFYRNFTYRFTCKKLSHGSSYMGTPRTISTETTIPQKQIAEFQERFFAAFPGIREWHHWVAYTLATQGFLVSVMGRKRWFMGRVDDDSTIREAVAFDPQETVAQLLNRGLFRLWVATKRDSLLTGVKPLLQIHDAVLVQYPENADEIELIPKLCSIIETPITLRHKDKTRKLLIPAAASVGWNWGEMSKANPDGLRDFTGERDERERQTDPAGNILDRRMDRSYG